MIKDALLEIADEMEETENMENTEEIITEIEVILEDAQETSEAESGEIT